MRFRLLCIKIFSIAIAKLVLGELHDRQTGDLGIHASSDANYNLDGSTPFQVATGPDPASPQEIDPATLANLGDGSLPFYQSDPGADSTYSQSLRTLEASTGSEPSEPGSSTYKWENPEISGLDVPGYPANQGASDEGADSSSSENSATFFGSTAVNPLTSTSQILESQNTENIFGNSAQGDSVQIDASTPNGCIEGSGGAASKKRDVKKDVCSPPRVFDLTGSSPAQSPQPTERPQGPDAPLITGPQKSIRRRCPGKKPNRKVSLCCNGPSDPPEATVAESVRQCFLCEYS